MDSENRKDEVLTPALQLRYACLKNIGILHYGKGNHEDALDAYLEVLL